MRVEKGCEGNVFAEREGFLLPGMGIRDKITKIKSNMLENVGMTREAVLHNRKINTKTGLPENKIIYSIFR